MNEGNLRAKGACPHVPIKGKLILRKLCIRKEVCYEREGKMNQILHVIRHDDFFNINSGMELRKNTKDDRWIIEQS